MRRSRRTRCTRSASRCRSGAKSTRSIWLRGGRSPRSSLRSVATCTGPSCSPVRAGLRSFRCGGRTWTSKAGPHVPPQKTGDQMMFPMGEFLTAMLTARLEADAPLNNPWLWPSTSGVRHTTEPKQQRHVLPSPHAYRHHARTLFIAAGVPYAESALLLASGFRACPAGRPRGAPRRIPPPACPIPGKQGAGPPTNVGSSRVPYVNIGRRAPRGASLAGA